MATSHLCITGKVQGVFFRASAKEVAEKCGVTGWIKNANGGSVEAMVSGSGQQVRNFIDWCRKGPPRAEVAEVIATEVEEINFPDFSVLK